MPAVASARPIPIPRRCSPPAATPPYRRARRSARRPPLRRWSPHRRAQMPTAATSSTSGPPEPSVPADVLLARGPQVAAVVVGPQLVLEDVLRVGRLPQHEVAGALLPRGTDEQVDVRDVGAVQVLGNRRLGDPARVDLARGGLLGEFACRFNDLGAA